jgi:hypothetical protein
MGEFHVERTHLILIGTVALTLATVTSAALAQQPAATEDRIATLLHQVPTTKAGMDERLALADERLAALAPTTQPADGVAADAPALVAARGLFDAWQQYRTRVERALALDAALAKLAAPETAAALAEEIATLQSAAAQLGESDPARIVTEQEVTQARELVAALEARASVLDEAQARRAALRSTGFAQQRSDLETRLRELRAQQQTPTAVPDTMPAEPTTTLPGTVTASQRQLELQIATVQLDLYALQLEERRVGEMYQREGPLLAAVREKLNAARTWASELAAALSQGELRDLEWQLERAATDDERAVLELRIFAVRVRRAYFMPARVERDLRAVVQLDELDAMQARQRTADAYWAEVEESLKYRSGGDIRELRWVLGTEQQELAGDLATVRSRHQTVMTRRRELESLRERTWQRFEQLAAQATRAIERATLTPIARAEKDAAIVTERGALADAIQGTLRVVGVLAERIEQERTALVRHQQRLQEIGQRLHWKRIGARDGGLLKTDWPAVGRELRALSGAWAASPPAAEDDAELALFGDRWDTRAKAARLVQRISRSFGGVPATGWGALAGALVAAIAVGALLWRLARRRGAGLARQIADDYVRARDEDTGPLFGVNARMNLLAWNMVGDLAIAWLAGGAILLLTNAGITDPLVRTNLQVLLLLVVATATLLRMTHHLFEPESPPHRVIPCPDDVARHYRWWLATLIVFAAVLLVLPTLLAVNRLAPTLQVGIIELFKAGGLLLLLLFLLPKQRVLGPGVQDRLHWGTILMSVLYPLFIIAAVGLLVLQIIGYGALVTFVGAGVIGTVLLVLVALVGSEYITDALEHRYGHTATAAALPSWEAEGDAGATASLPAHYLLSLTNAFVRVLAAAGALAAILWLWNVPVGESWLNWRMIGLDALTVLIALIVDRVLYAALFTLYRTGRLPLSTTRLLRRWTRAALVVLVVLTMVAIAGWKIDSLWTFLTTLLAMIAIGFVAVWSILSNLLATVVILIWRPFNVGEEVEVVPEGITGRIVDISFMYTTLKAADGSRTSVPNSLWVQKLIKRTPSKGVVTRSLVEQLEREKPLGE